MVDPKQDCMSTNCVYRITCNLCPSNNPKDQAIYIGQSGRSLHARQAEHQQGITKSATTCPMVRHVSDSHAGLTVTPGSFTMNKIRGSKDNMSRMLGEGEEIKIAEANGSKLMNSKGEFGKTKLIRWTQTVSQV